MNTDLIERIDGEENDLALHVQLCEQRYIQLINKFDTVDDRFNKIETILVEIKKGLSDQASDTYKTYLKWAGVVIVALLGAVIHLVTK